MRAERNEEKVPGDETIKGQICVFVLRTANDIKMHGQRKQFILVLLFIVISISRLCTVSVNN